MSRSREGAWIEISQPSHTRAASSRVAPVRERGLKSTHEMFSVISMAVAPVRERGLKWQRYYGMGRTWGRSREGAWIEINPDRIYKAEVYGRSREGAWIEIFIKQRLGIPYSCRSREGAWIEIRSQH